MNRLYLHVAALAFLFASSAGAETTAIVGGTVHTVGPQGTIENATVIIADGRIAAVGSGLKAPDGATTIDASGKVLTPGLFTPTGTIGLKEVGYSAGPLDAQQRGDTFTAGFDVADSFNRRSTLIAINRVEGITRAAIMPMPGWPDEEGRGHVLSGLGAIVNLGDGNDSIERRAAAMVVSLGEGGSTYAGGTRTAALLTLRNALSEAIDYRDHRDDFERGARRPYQHSVADLEALQGVLSGATPLLASVDRASDIEVLIRLAGEFDIRVIIESGAEAWMHANELAAAGIPVILAPMAILPSNFDWINARPESSAILAAAGVTISFADGSGTTHNAGNITQSAGNAVANGLPWDDGLRAITLAPAEIFGVADKSGSIEVGKEADIVIWPGDPLELTNFPEQVFIKGEAVPMESRQTLLRDRYMQTEPDKPPAFRR